MYALEDDPTPDTFIEKGQILITQFGKRGEENFAITEARVLGYNELPKGERVYLVESIDHKLMGIAFRPGEDSVAELQCDDLRVLDSQYLGNLESGSIRTDTIVELGFDPLVCLT